MMIARAHSEHGDSTSMSPDGTDKASDQEAGATPLASLVDIGWEVGLADYAALASNPASEPDELGDLLSESLFGEVIDISDLIPPVLSPSAEAAELQPVTDTTGTEFGELHAGDVAAASSHATGVLTILYDDDILASGSTIL